MVSAWVLMRAFAAGCTAVTDVGAFKEPVIRNAHRTLTLICLTLGLLVARIVVIA